MKRFFIYIIFLLPVFISGCNKTNKQIPVEVIIQRKADSIAKAATLECLFYPETYDPIKTQVDSISGSVYITPKIVNAAIQIIKLKKEFPDFCHAVHRLLQNRSASDASAPLALGVSRDSDLRQRGIGRRAADYAYALQRDDRCLHRLPHLSDRSGGLSDHRQIGRQ